MNNNLKLNLLDDPKGRKWSWGHLKWIGEFTAIDFIFIFFSLLFCTSLFVIFIFKFDVTEGIILGTIFTIIDLLLVVTLIKEWAGNKSYELIIAILFSSFRRKQYSLGYITEKETQKEFMEGNDE